MFSRVYGSCPRCGTLRDHRRRGGRRGRLGWVIDALADPVRRRRRHLRSLGLAALAAVAAAVAFAWASAGAARLPAGTPAIAFAAILGAGVGAVFAWRCTHGQRSQGRRHWRGTAADDAEHPAPDLPAAPPAVAGAIDDDWNVDALLGGDPVDDPAPALDIDWGDLPAGGERASGQGPGAVTAVADAAAEGAAPALAGAEAPVPTQTDDGRRVATAPKRARKPRPAPGRRSRPRSR